MRDEDDYPQRFPKMARRHVERHSQSRTRSPNSPRPADRTRPERDGNWHVGAIAVLVDNVGAAAIASYVGHVQVSVDFNEEVEIEGKAIGHKDKLSLVEVNVKKKDSGELIVIAKQWMSSKTSKL
ncbi:hypothetical protein Acr_11g0013630 [Actinidia rufa]|uniref:Thioesterase superfamily protein n=1 Tax=Actinidia rufa TaxID=165716 RepID=A0A7J0FGM1_9ERIC|nr:hypothetical protein Acr_11g0013630 [Actinidia rufa]